MTKDNSSNPYKVDPDMYEAIVTSIDLKQGAKGDFLGWQFKIIDPVQDGEYVTDRDLNVSGATPNDFRDGTKLDTWLKACGVSSEDGDEVDTDDAVGQKVKVLVEDKKTDPNYSQVTKLFPGKKAKKSKDEDEDESENKKKDKKKDKKKKDKKKKDKKAKKGKQPKKKKSKKKRKK